MTTTRFFMHLVLSLALAILEACADDDSQTVDPARERDASAPTNSNSEPGGNFAGCVRGSLESDLEASPLAGPGVREGALEPGDYVVSSTYLQIKLGKNARLQELSAPILDDLGSRAGLVALSLGNSRTCNVARTLTVWRDDAAMLEFVIGDAHSTAVQAVSELSRGGSVVTHWSGDEKTASWKSAAEHLAADDGPEY
jgi:heme-degrading monooxygenase HmoA